MTHMIWEFYRVRPNWFLRIWYVPCKPYTYISLRLALSPNRPNRAFTWASSHTSTIGNFHNGFWAYGALGTNHAPILHRNENYLQLDVSEIPYDTLHLVVLSSASTVPSGVSKLISEHMVCSMQTVQLSWIKIRTISKQTEPWFHMSLFTKEYHQVCPK